MNARNKPASRGHPSTRRQRTPRLLAPILSVLIILLAAQASGVLDMTSKWWVVTATAIVAFLVSAWLCWLNFRLARPRTKSATPVQDSPVEPSAGPVTAYLFANYRWPSFAAAALLLVLSILFGLKSSGAFTSPPTGTFTNPKGQGQTLSSTSGKYLFGLRNVENVSGDLVWLELRVPEYTSSYGPPHYLYYYTQAVPDPDFGDQYSAVVEIDNTGLTRTTDIVTAFACNATDTVIHSGNSDPQTSKVAGCDTLAYICVQLPSCKGRGCIPDIFATPPTCKNKPTYIAKRVS